MFTHTDFFFMKCLPILLDSPFYFKRKQTLLLTINNQSKSFNDVPVIADNNFLHTHTLSNALRYLHSTTEFIHFVIPNAYIYTYVGHRRPHRNISLHNNYSVLCVCMLTCLAANTYMRWWDFLNCQHLFRHRVICLCSLSFVFNNVLINLISCPSCGALS